MFLAGVGSFHGRVERRCDLRAASLARCIRPKGSSVPVHRHEGATFVCLTEGDHWFESSRGRWTQSVRWAWYYRPKGSAHVHLECPTDIASIGWDVDTSAFALGDEIGGIERGARLDPDRGAPIARRLIAELERADQSSRIVAEGLLFELVGLTLRGPEDANRVPRWMTRVRDALVERFSEPLSVAELARDAGVHPSYLSRAFRRHFGVTIGEFVRDRRFEWAMAEVRKGEKTLSEIAVNAGFADGPHFSRAFRARYGASPKALRP